VIALVVAMSAVITGSAHAVDLSGACATRTGECSRGLHQEGRTAQIGFTLASGQHGGGFIVEADRPRGKGESCKIEIRNEDRRTVNFIAACVT
jgi:hypothetical protein